MLQVTIKFQIPPTCEIALLIAKLVSRLGVKIEEHGTGSDMTLRAWDRLVSRIFLVAISSLFVFRFNLVSVCAPLMVNGEIHHIFWISSKSLCTNISYILLMFYEASTSCYQFFVCFLCYVSVGLLGN